MKINSLKVQQYWYLIHTWSEKSVQGTVVHRKFPSLHWGSLEITLTVPLSDDFYERRTHKWWNTNHGPRRATRGGQAPPLAWLRGGHAPPLRSLAPPVGGGARSDKVHPVLQFSDSWILTQSKFKSPYRKIKKKIIER